MNKFLLLVSCALAWALAPSLASADPLSSLIISALGGAAALGTVGVALVQLGVGLVLSQLSNLGRKKQRPPGIQTDTTTAGDTTPWSFILGEYATAGNLVAPVMSHGVSGSTPNAYLTYVMDWSDLPVDGFSYAIVDGQVHNFDGATHANYGQTTDRSGYVGKVWHRFYDGSQTTVDPDLLSKYSSYPERPWASDMVGEDIAYSIFTFKYDRKVWNGFPTVLGVVRGIPLYDPRLDTTVGGTGSHRLDDPGTWAFTKNPMVMVYNILIGIPLGGGRRFGVGCSQDDLPLDYWFAAMNVCDVSVGGKPQYEAGYEVKIGSPEAGGTSPLDVIDELLLTCAGQLVDQGGMVLCRAGGPGLPVMSFTDDDVVRTSGQDLDPFPSSGATHNAVHASYPSPQDLWTPRDAPARYDLAAEAADGERLVADLVLNAVTDGDRVQQLMASWLKDARRMLSHRVTLPPEAMVLSPLDVVEWSSTRNGYVSKTFEVGEIAQHPTRLTVALSLREVEAGDWVFNPASDLYAHSSPSTEPVIIAATSLPGWTVAPAIIEDSGSNSRRPALQLSWSAGLDDVRSISWTIRVKATGTVVSRGTITDVENTSVIASEGILSGVEYEAQATMETDRPTIATLWLSAVAPILLLTSDDLDPSIALGIASDVEAALASEFAAVDAAAALATAKADEAAKFALASASSGSGNLLGSGSMADPALWIRYNEFNVEPADIWVSDVDGQGTPGFFKNVVDGGYLIGTMPVIVDPAKTYRISVQVKKESSSLGYTYLTWCGNLTNYPASSVWLDPLFTFTVGQWVTAFVTKTGSELLSGASLSTSESAAMRFGVSIDHGLSTGNGIRVKDFRLVDITESLAAESHAIASSASAVAASDSADAAATQATNSLNSANASAASASTASTKADEASASASAATAQKVLAETAAGNASVSESAAAVSEFNAANSASAASLSATVTARNTAEMAGSPGVLLQGLDHFTASVTGAPEDVQPIADSPTYGPRLSEVPSTHPTVGGMDVIATSAVHLQSINTYQIDPTRKYRIRARVKRDAYVSGNALLYIGRISLDANYNPVGANSGHQYPAASGLNQTTFPVGAWTTFESADLTGTDTGQNQFPSGTTQVRLLAFLNYQDDNSGNVMRIAELTLEDVTVQAQVTTNATAVTNLGNAIGTYAIGASVPGGSSTLKLTAARVSDGAVASLVEIDTGIFKVTSDLALFGGQLQSTNYNAGVDGWKIDSLGNAEFNTLLVRRSNIPRNTTASTTTSVRTPATSVPLDPYASNTYVTSTGTPVMTSPVDYFDSSGISAIGFTLIDSYTIDTGATEELTPDQLRLSFQVRYLKHTFRLNQPAPSSGLRSVSHGLLFRTRKGATNLETIGASGHHCLYGPSGLVDSLSFGDFATMAPLLYNTHYGINETITVETYYFRHSNIPASNLFGYTNTTKIYHTLEKVFR